MSVPTHDITCISKAFPTTCPSCSEAVWFFSCSCGSKVYFDQLGYPWEFHECIEFRLKREVSLIQNAERLSSEEIYQMITAHEKRAGVEVDDKVLEMIEDVLGRRKYEFVKSEVLPRKGLEDISGKVMAMNNPVNIFKKLGYDPTPIGKKLLGKIGESEWAQIVVRTRPDKKNKSLEYTCFVKKSYLKEHPIRSNEFIVGAMEGLEHLRGIIWILKSHTVL